MADNRWRYHVAEALNRLPNQCWADLVSWAERWTNGLPWRPAGDTCRRDLARTGTCYCGKMRDRAVPP